MAAQKYGWHSETEVVGTNSIWIAAEKYGWFLNRSGFQMLNMDEKRINMTDFALSAAQHLFKRHCKKRTKNGNSGIL